MRDLVVDLRVPWSGCEATGVSGRAGWDSVGRRACGLGFVRVDLPLSRHGRDSARMWPELVASRPAFWVDLGGIL